MHYETTTMTAITIIVITNLQNTMITTDQWRNGHRRNYNTINNVKNTFYYLGKL